MARFTESELRRLKNSIILITRTPRDGSQEKIKGRLIDWDDESLELRGDKDVEDQTHPPDDIAPQPPGISLKRLATGQMIRIRFDDAQEVQWTA